MSGTQNRESIQKEAYDSSIHKHRRTIALSVGTGKTKVALDIAESYTKIYVVISKKNMKDNWLKEQEKHKSSVHLNFVTYVSLPKLNPSSVDLLILDEAHSVTESHYKWLSEKYKGSILGLTGTPPKYGIKKAMLDRFFPICYEKYEDDIIDLSIINDYRIVVHGLELDSTKNIKVLHGKNKEKHFYTSEVKIYDWAKTKDSLIILANLSKFKTKLSYIKRLVATSDKKTIVFVNQKKQADSLGDSYHSDNPNSEDNLTLFQSGIIKHLYCIQQLNEGVNIKDLECGIIMHAYANPRITRQRIGRTLRLSPDKVCTVHVLCYKNTIEEAWVNEALADYDQSKIKYVHNLI